MNGYQLRTVAPTDQERVLWIFNYYVQNGFAAYPEEPVSQEFFSILSIGATAFYVVEGPGEEGVVGFGLMRPFMPFPAFRHTVTLSYFLAPDHRRQGLGSLLLERFERDAMIRGISVLLASISSRNAESIAFHLKHGFVECGRLEKVGIKFGKPFDVVWMQKNLG